MSVAKRGQVREVAHRLGEVVVEVGQDLFAQLLEVDREVRRLAGQGRLAVVLGEGDVELGRVADLEADQVRLEARDEALLAEDERHPLRRAALERLAVPRAREPDDRVVAFLGAAVLDRREGRVLVAQLLDDLVDRASSIGSISGPKLKLLVVAERDLRPDLDGGLEDERLAFLGLDDLDVGVGQGQQVLLDEGLRDTRPGRGGRRRPRGRRPARGAAPGAAVGPCRAGTRALASPRQVSDGLVNGAVQALGGQLDLEDDRRFGGWGGGDLHLSGV